MRTQRPRRGARAPSVPFGSSGGRLVPCCSLVQVVFQWSAEPNSSVTCVAGRYPSSPSPEAGFVGVWSVGAHRPGQACACCSHRDGSHPLIVLIRYSERGDLQGPQRLRRCTGAPRCLFRLPASVFESDPLIYPATLFWRRFGCTGLVGGFSFSAKFICMGKWGVGTGFDSRPYKKCAHFAHFAGNLCRVTRTPRAQGHQPQGHPGPA